MRTPDYILEMFKIEPPDVNGPRDDQLLMRINRHKKERWKIEAELTGVTVTELITRAVDAHIRAEDDRFR